MGYIYKIINDVNDKIYIGQTINTIEYRFNNHINAAKQSIHKNKFHDALIEIGPEHFKIELVEECMNDRLNQRECYWIKYYDSVNKGYNTTWGGSAGFHYDREILLKLWNQGITIQKISNKIGIDRGLLGQILKAEGITQEEINKRKYIANREQITCRKVYQIDPNNGKIIKEWNRINDIERELGISHTTIIKCCNLQPQAKTAGGYAWRYIENYNPETDKEELIQYTIRDILKNTKHVLMYSKDNILLKEYASAKIAGTATGKTDRNIARYCRGERKDPDGYIWKYK